MNPSFPIILLRAQTLLRLSFLLLLHRLGNHVDEIIEEFVRVLMQCTPEEFIVLLELIDEGLRCYGCACFWLGGDGDEEVVKGREEGRFDGSDFCRDRSVRRGRWNA